jgi:hypothetical protein
LKRLKDYHEDFTFCKGIPQVLAKGKRWISKALLEQRFVEKMRKKCGLDLLDFGKKAGTLWRTIDLLKRKMGISPTFRIPIL